MAAVRQYRLLPAGLEAAQRIALQRYLIPQIAVVSVFLIASFVIGMRRAGFGMIVATGVFIALLLAYTFVVSPRRVRRRLDKCWESYRLTIGDDYLLRQQADTPDVRLPFAEISRVERLPGRYLKVIGSGRYQVIAIPESIENFSDVLNTISQLKPPTIVRRDLSMRTFLLTAGGFAAYLVMLFGRSPRVVLPLALVVGAMLLRLFFFMQRNPNIPTRNKRISWVYLLFVPLCVFKALEMWGRIGR
jgi:hypothetical protein